MITWTQLYTRSADIVGINSSTSTQDLNNIKRDINQGVRLFKNAARRYWTRQEKSTPLNNTQQFYQLPRDCVRVTEVWVINGTLRIPLTQIDSEQLWNSYNVMPVPTLNMPTHFFIKGYGEIGIWPIPSGNTSSTLYISYEPRLVDMSLEDTTSTSNSWSNSNSGTPVTLTINNADTTVTFSQNIAAQTMVGQWLQVTDGTDGQWYQIGNYVSANSVKIISDFEGISGSGKTFTIGQCPDIPEDYHMAPVYFAAYNYYLKRSDDGLAMEFKALFQDLFNQYVEVYGDKTTGQVQSLMSDRAINMFYLPPNPIT